MLKKVFKVIASVSFVSSFATAQSVEQGIRLIEIEKFSSAKRELSAVLAKTPTEANANFYLGKIYLKENKLDSAAMQFEKGIVSAPKNPLNFVGKGTIAWINKKNDEAKLLFDQATSLGKRNALMYFNIGEAYSKYEPKNYAEALTILKDKALIYDKNMIDAHLLIGDIYLYQGDGSNAVSNYNNALNVNANSAKALYKKGQSYVYAKNPMEGLNLYLKAAQVDSSYTPIYRELGELYAKVQRYQEALTAYKKYIDRSDKDVDVLFNYGQFLFLAKDYIKSIDVLKSLQSSIKNPVLIRILGYNYYETGDYSNAKTSLESFFALQTADKVIAQDYSYYGKTLQKLGNDTVGAENIKKAYLIDTTLIETIKETANNFLSNKKYKKAAEYYTLYLSKKPKSGGEILNLGKTYYVDKQYAKSDSVFGLLISYFPTSAQAYIWKARATDQMDNKPNEKMWTAKPLFEKFIETSKEDAKYKSELLQTYAYLGRYFRESKTEKDCTKSIDYWTKVKNLDPTSKPAEEGLKCK